MNQKRDMDLEPIFVALQPVIASLIQPPCQSLYALLGKTRHFSTMRDCTSIVKGLCLPVCGWQTKSDSEEWSRLRSGHEAGVCVCVCVCVCVFVTKVGW